MALYFVTLAGFNVTEYACTNTGEVAYIDTGYSDTV